jgi:hypothetical protein
VTTKTCPRCGQTKPLDQFHAHPHTRDRRASHCKACANRPAQTENRVTRSRARKRALEDLAKQHPDDFRRYYNARLGRPAPSPQRSPSSSTPPSTRRPPPRPRSGSRPAARRSPSLSASGSSARSAPPTTSAATSARCAPNGTAGRPA